MTLGYTQSRVRIGTGEFFDSPFFMDFGSEKVSEVSEKSF